MRVERTIGAKPVSSSRTMTFATKAVATNMERGQDATVCAITNGAFLWTLSVAADLDVVEVTEPKASRKKIDEADPEDGWRSW